MTNIVVLVRLDGDGEHLWPAPSRHRSLSEPDALKLQEVADGGSTVQLAASSIRAAKAWSTTSGQCCAASVVPSQWCSQRPVVHPPATRACSVASTKVVYDRPGDGRVEV